MTIAEFILARVAEDEAAAEKAQRFKYDHPADAPWCRARLAVEQGIAFSSDKHIARWDPARVLAECAAKRRIVERWVRLDTAQALGKRYMYQSVCDLAAIYAAHPDYDESWTL